MRNVVVSVVLLAMSSCSKRADDTAKACDEKAALESVGRLGKQKFPDNPRVVWKGTSHRAKNDVSYVEALPTPDEVGYSKFVFAMGCVGAAQPKMYGAYALEKSGQYALLFTSDGAPALPASPP